MDLLLSFLKVLPTSTMVSLLEAPTGEIQYGIATEPRTPRSFRGRGGVWACENCNKTKLLTKGSKKWTCEQCKKVMWVTPISECPLEKARRFIQNKRQELENAKTEEAKDTAAVQAERQPETLTQVPTANSLQASAPAPVPAPFPPPAK